MTSKRPSLRKFRAPMTYIGLRINMRWGSEICLNAKLIESRLRQSIKVLVNLGDYTFLLLIGG